MSERSGKSWLDGAGAALGVTLLVPLAVAATPRIGLPGVDLSALDRVAGGSAGLLRGDGRSAVDVFAIGLLPYLSANIFVEVVAVVVPSLNRLRHGGPAGRAKLGRAATLLAVVLAGFQSLGVAKMLEGLAGPEAIGAVSVPLVALTLVTGTVVLGLLADFATRRGLVSGFLTILIALEAVSLGKGFGRFGYGAEQRSTELVAMLAGALAAAGATWAVLRAQKPTIRLEPAKSSEPYRAKGLPADASSVDVPTPPSGLEPLFLTAALLTFPATLASLHFPFANLAANALRNTFAFRAASLASIVVFAVTCGWLFYQPSRVATLWRRAGSPVAFADLRAAARRLLRRGIAISLLYLVGLFAIDTLVGRFGGPGKIVLVAALLVAIGLDLVDSWRARRRAPDFVVVWPDQRSYAIAVARAVLGAADIPLFVRGEWFRRLSPFSPIVPLDLMVPAALAKRASNILERTLGPEATAERSEPPVRVAPDPDPRSGWSVAAAAAVVGVAALAIPAKPPEPKRGRGPMRPDTMQLVAIDDDVDPRFDSMPRSSYPSCLAIAVENAPVGRGKTALRHFAKCLNEDGMTRATARERLLGWMSAVALPPGNRFLTGPVEDYDEAPERFAPIGVRSWLMKNESILDGNDVREAEARMSGPSGNERPVVVVELTPAGGEKLFRFTSKSVGRRMAIVVDGSVMSTPVISAPISAGRVQITMGAGEVGQQIREAEHLADVLMGRTSAASATDAP